LKVTGILCKWRELRSTSMYSLGLSPFVSLDHPQSTHSALGVNRSRPTRHSPVSELTSLLLARLHIVYEGQTSDGRGRLSSVGVVCNTAHMQRNSPGAVPGGPVMLRPVRATPCYNDFGHEVVAGRNIPHAGFGSSCMPYGRTTQYGTHTWIVTSPLVSLQTPPDGRPHTPPPCTPPIDTPGLAARAPRWLAQI